MRPKGGPVGEVDPKEQCQNLEVTNCAICCGVMAGTELTCDDFLICSSLWSVKCSTIRAEGWS